MDIDETLLEAEEKMDKALEVDRLQQEKGGEPAMFVPSGGQGADEVISEGEAMERYLLSKGIPGERILREDRSVNTRENMAFSQKLIAQAKPEGKVGFTTTGYHVFRAGVYAAEANLRAEGTGSPTRWYFWPNAFVREMIALLVDRKKVVLINLLFALAVSIALGIADYCLG